ncbi:MAG: hypothetical protein FWF37_02395 [Chloroflexi bacterium]|nr:hypothetical protein [Chloroflexota bacterium]
METKDVFNQQLRNTSGCALMFIAMFFIITAINGLFTESIEPAIIFGTLGIIMLAAGIFLPSPRMTWINIIGLLILASGVWLAFRGISNAVGLIIGTEGASLNQLWLWGGIGIAAIAIGWFIMYNLLNTSNHRIGTLIMLASALILAIGINMTGWQGFIAFIVVVIAAVVFGLGYKRFIKKETD